MSSDYIPSFNRLEMLVEDTRFHDQSVKSVFEAILSEMRDVCAELKALKESKYTVPDGYRVMLIHESE